VARAAFCYTLATMPRHLPIFDSLALETKGRHPIANVFGKPQRPKDSLDAFFDAMRKIWPDLVRRSWDSTYNCYGMAFGARRTAVDEAALRVIFEDDGYRRVPRDQALPGDIAIYRDKTGEVSHVGIIIQRRLVTTARDDDLVILSQWGFDGEFIHGATKVPEAYGPLTEIWSDRKT